MPGSVFFTPSACPHLPDAPPAMDWRALHELGPDRGASFYRRCLDYGQYLWIRGLAARAILSVDRGLLCADETHAEVLAQHPPPYRALTWMILHTPGGVFVGNPRVHYQHLADRVRGAHEERRRWRAWAMWSLARAVRPDLPADPAHAVREPSEAEIDEALARHGLPGEAALWREVRAQNSRTLPP